MHTHTHSAGHRAAIDSTISLVRPLVSERLGAVVDVLLEMVVGRDGLVSVGDGGGGGGPTGG